MIWKPSVLIAIALCAPLLAVGWSLLTDGMFVLPLGRYGAAFIGRYTVGYNLEDSDGGYHGLAWVYFPTTFTNTMPDGTKVITRQGRWITTQCPPTQRKLGVTYVGAPDSLR